MNDAARVFTNCTRAIDEARERAASKNPPHWLVDELLFPLAFKLYGLAKLNNRFHRSP